MLLPFRIFFDMYPLLILAIFQQILADQYILKRKIMQFGALKLSMISFAGLTLDPLKI